MVKVLLCLPDVLRFPGAGVSFSKVTLPLDVVSVKSMQMILRRRWVQVLADVVLRHPSAGLLATLVHITMFTSTVIIAVARIMHLNIVPCILLVEVGQWLLRG